MATPSPPVAQRHLAAPRSQRSGEVLNTFARAAHAPQLALRVDKRLTDALPKGVF